MKTWLTLVSISLIIIAGSLVLYGAYCGCIELIKKVFCEDKERGD